MNASVSLLHFPALLFTRAKPSAGDSGALGAAGDLHDAHDRHDLEVVALERQLRRAALRGQPIVLGSADRYADAAEGLDYVFATLVPSHTAGRVGPIPF